MRIFSSRTTCHFIVFSIFSADSLDMKIQMTVFYHNVINYMSQVKLSSVVFVIVLLYMFLALLRRRLLKSSQKDHAFGESFLSETYPNVMVKVKIVWAKKEDVFSFLKHVGTRINGNRFDDDFRKSFCERNWCEYWKLLTNATSFNKPSFSENTQKISGKIN